MKSDDAWAHLSTLCRSDRDFDALEIVRDENYKFWRQAQQFAAIAKKLKAKAKRDVKS
jgi:hypothetical protein